MLIFFACNACFCDSSGFDFALLNAFSIKRRIDQLIKIDKMPIESHVVTSRILYEYEKTIFM